MTEKPLTDSPMTEEPMTDEEIIARAEEIRQRGETAPRAALDPVDRAMIRHWAEAIGDCDRRWHGPDAVAPPAMAQVWTMYGLDPHRPADDPLHGTMQILDEAGFTSVLGTDCHQTYERFLRPGEQVEVTTRLESVVGPKQTAVGVGWFVTSRSVWRVPQPDGSAEQVADMTFRVLKFRPGTGRRPKADPAQTVRPMVDRDNAFFFEGTAAGELRIQRCRACGELRHPPGPVCPQCHAMDRGHVVASGRGTVHSFLVHHAPQVPGKELPLTLVLVELEEGVRMVGALVGAEPDEPPAIGDPVEVVFDRIDDDLTLASWRPAERAEIPPREGTSPPVTGQQSTAERAQIPPWSLPITPTVVVSTALATRDFQDVHHDRDLAVQRGSKDIFLNILTTTGLVQRYVGDWAREQGWHDFRVTACALRLGAPAHPGDTLELTGDVVSDDGDEVVVDVVGAVGPGNHVTARVTFVREDR